MLPNLPRKNHESTGALKIAVVTAEYRNDPEFRCFLPLSLTKAQRKVKLAIVFRGKGNDRFYLPGIILLFVP
jgi:hypothetical protein